MKNHYRALRPLAQDLTESPGSELRLRLLARAGAGTSGLWRPGYQAGGGPEPLSSQFSMSFLVKFSRFSESCQ